MRRSGGEVDDLVERDTCSVQVDSDTVCSSSVDRLFEVFVWQVLRFEGVPFASWLDFLRCFEPAVFKSLRPLVSLSGRDVRLLLRADDRDADGCGRDSRGDGGNKSKAQNVKHINVQEWGPVRCWTLTT